MLIEEFATKYNLRIRDKKLAKRYRLSWAEDVVPGRLGEIAEFAGEAEFRLRLFAVPRNAGMTKSLRSRYKAALAGGLRLKHKADAESIFYFDATNGVEAELAIKLVGARRRRTYTLTAEQQAKVVARLRGARGARGLPFLEKEVADGERFGDGCPPSV